jgi:hypothetical protein
MADAFEDRFKQKYVVVSAVRLRSHACPTSVCVAPLPHQPGQLGIPNAQVQTPRVFFLVPRFFLTSSF